MKTRFTDEQIIQMIKEQEAGEKTADVCRRYGISQGTFYKYKSKYGGMEPSDAKKLRALKAESAKLKKLLAEAWETLEAWQEDYNNHRPHSALGNLTPREFAEKTIMDKLAA